MTSKGEVVLVSEIEKGSTWLFPYWQALQNSRPLFSKGLHKFKTCLSTLTEGWPSHWCHILTFKEDVETEKPTEVQLCLTQTGDVVDLHKLTGFDTGLMSFD